MTVQILNGTISWNGNDSYSGTVWQICFEFTDSILHLDEVKKRITEAVNNTTGKIIITPFALPYLEKQKLMDRKRAASSYNRLISGITHDAVVCMPFNNFDVDLTTLTDNNLQRFVVTPARIV